MKKIILLCTLVFFLTGCTTINDSNISIIINSAINSRSTTKNVNRNGYRYYLPKGVSIKSSDSFNEIITSEQYKYYLYVDIVSYNNKTAFSYNKNEEAYYSDSFKNGDKIGFIEINNYKNDQYIIEIMYNYAKIEVIGYESDIKNIVTYAIVILSSITYNDNVIESYLSNRTYDSVEEKFDIFEIVGSDNYLQFTEEENTDDGKKDPDYVN